MPRKTPKAMKKMPKNRNASAILFFTDGYVIIRMIDEGAEAPSSIQKVFAVGEE